MGQKPDREGRDRRGSRVERWFGHVRSGARRQRVALSQRVTIDLGEPRQLVGQFVGRDA